MPHDVAPLVVPATTAVLVNEVQPSTTAGAGGLAEEASKVLPDIVRLVEGARDAGVQVVQCLKIFRRDALARNRNTPLYRRQGTAPATGDTPPPTPDSRPAAGSVVQPELGPDERDIVMTRLHGMGAVTDTGVVPVLRNLGITTVVVCGVSLNVGIPNTAMDLMNHGFEVVVPADAVAGTPAEYGAMVIQHTLKVVATVTTVDELLRAWRIAA